jgi:hypothetical protein
VIVAKENTVFIEFQVYHTFIYRFYSALDINFDAHLNALNARYNRKKNGGGKTPMFAEIK